MKRFRWTVEFEVDESWVADGFNLTDSRALDMLASDLVFAHPGELSARVVKAPAPSAIAKAQGYASADITLDPSSPFGFRAVS